MQNSQGCYGISGVNSGPSVISLVGHAGYGSTNTKIKRFASAPLLLGSAFTYVDSPVFGGEITIRVPGVYVISYGDAADAAAVTFHGISVNTTAPTTDVDSLTYAQGLRALSECPFVDGPANVCIALPLYTGDKVRAHTKGAAMSNAPAGLFTMALLRTF